MRHTSRSEFGGTSPKGWFKKNFDCSVQGDKAGVSFIVRNDIGVLVGADNIPVTSVSILEPEIRGLWKAIC